MRTRKMLAVFCVAVLWSLAASAQDSPPVSRQTIEESKAKALAGDPEAEYQMALYYYQGVPGIFEPDKAESGRWLNFAAEHGSRKARVLIAASIMAQNSPEEAREKALQWLEEGKAQHDVTSILVLASIYEQGKGVRADADTALTILKENAALPEIANELGEIYFRGGLGQTIDYSLAMQYFQAAADKRLSRRSKECRETLLPRSRGSTRLRQGLLLSQKSG